MKQLLDFMAIAGVLYVIVGLGLLWAGDRRELEHQDRIEHRGDPYGQP
jgi:hypothetical protein